MKWWAIMRAREENGYGSFLSFRRWCHMKLIGKAEWLPTHKRRYSLRDECFCSRITVTRSGSEATLEESFEEIENSK